MTEDRSYRICVGTRILAEVTRHTGATLDGDTIEFRAFFSANLTPREREIVLQHYLQELLA